MINKEIVEWIEKQAAGFMGRPTPTSSYKYTGSGFSKPGLRRGAEIAMDYGAPLIAGMGGSLAAHETGMSPLSSALMGVAAGSIASPRDWHKAYKNRFRDNKGGGPISGFMGQMKPQVAQKAQIAGFAVVPSLVANLDPTIRNLRSTSDAWNRGSASTADLAAKIDAGGAPIMADLKKATQGFGDASESLATSTENVGSNLEEASGQAAGLMSTTQQLAETVGKGPMARAVQDAADTVNKWAPAAVAIGAGGLLIGGIMALNSILSNKKLPFGGGGAARKPRKRNARVTLRKPGNYDIRLSDDEHTHTPEEEEEKVASIREKLAMLKRADNPAAPPAWDTIRDAWGGTLGAVESVRKAIDAGANTVNAGTNAINRVGDAARGVTGAVDAGAAAVNNAGNTYDNANAAVLAGTNAANQVSGVVGDVGDTAKRLNTTLGNADAGIAAGTNAANQVSGLAPDVRRTLGNADSTLSALKWAPAALAGIPTAGYLAHQYLKGSYDDKEKEKVANAYMSPREWAKHASLLKPTATPGGALRANSAKAMPTVTGGRSSTQKIGMTGQLAAGAGPSTARAAGMTKRSVAVKRALYIQTPEVERRKARIRREQLDNATHGSDHAVQDMELGSLAKSAGYWSELGSNVNPVNAYGGNFVGMLAALATPTRDIREQANADQSMWKNLLIPGVGGYNAMKRVGHSVRGPEITKERDELEQEQLDARKKKRAAKDGEKSAAEYGRMLAKQAADPAPALPPAKPPAKPIAPVVAPPASTKPAIDPAQDYGGGGMRRTPTPNPSARDQNAEYLKLFGDKAQLGSRAGYGALLGGLGLAGAHYLTDDEEDRSLGGTLGAGLLGAGMGSVGGAGYGLYQGATDPEVQAALKTLKTPAAERGREIASGLTGKETQASDWGSQMAKEACRTSKRSTKTYTVNRNRVKNAAGPLSAGQVMEAAPSPKTMGIGKSTGAGAGLPSALQSQLSRARPRSATGAGAGLSPSQYSGLRDNAFSGAGRGPISAQSVLSAPSMKTGPTINQFGQHSPPRQPPMSRQPNPNDILGPQTMRPTPPVNPRSDAEVGMLPGAFSNFQDFTPDSSPLPMPSKAPGGPLGNIAGAIGAGAGAAGGFVPPRPPAIDPNQDYGGAGSSRPSAPTTGAPAMSQDDSSLMEPEDPSQWGSAAGMAGQQAGQSAAETLAPVSPDSISAPEYTEPAADTLAGIEPYANPDEATAKAWANQQSRKAREAEMAQRRSRTYSNAKQDWRGRNSRLGG